MDGWVRNAEGRLVNLSMCSTVDVAANGDHWVVTAWSSRQFNQVLARYDTEASARQALRRLGDQLDAVALAPDRHIGEPSPPGTAPAVAALPRTASAGA